MKTLKKVLLALIFASIAIPAVQATTIRPTIRSTALVLAGGAVAYKCLEMTKKIMDKILEEDPTLDDATLLKKVTTILRYGFGLTTALAGTYCAIIIIANANNENFLTPNEATTNTLEKMI